MFEKPSKLRSAILGGLIIGAISGIPGLNLLNCCCCAGILLGGAMSVYLYRQEFTNEMPPMESSDALILGNHCRYYRCIDYDMPQCDDYSDSWSGRNGNDAQLYGEVDAEVRRSRIYSAGHIG